MEIGIVGAGKIGGSLATLLHAAGHQVTISSRHFARVPDRCAGIRVAPVSDCAHRAACVVLALPYNQVFLLSTDPLAGKVVVDATNYWVHRDGSASDFSAGPMTSTERVQRHLGESIVVKAFNAMKWTSLTELARPRSAPDRVCVPIAGDDAAAVATVAHLVDDAGFDPVPVGRLDRSGPLLEPGGALHGLVASARQAEELIMRIDCAL